jgi:putative adenylate-forming enzyme
MLQSYYQQSEINVILKMGPIKAVEHFTVRYIKNLQTKRLKKLLKHVLRNSIFYQWYYKQYGITLRNFEDICVEDLPTIDKNIMMDHYDDFVCDRTLKRKNLEEFLSCSKNGNEKYRNSYMVIHTSGSSGTIALFVYGPNDWALAKALVATRVLKAYRHCYRRQKLSFIGAADGHYAGICLASAATGIFIRFAPLPINIPLDTIDHRVNAFHPEVLSGYSSGVHLLAQEQLKGNISLLPDRIICSADPLTLEMRDTITKAFRREPINFYAASESLCMAAQCERRENLHLFTDWHIFEATDHDLRPVAPGTPGNLLLTNLYNYTQPLIRYRMNDEVVLPEQSCGCGWPFPTMSNLAGRVEEFLWFDNAEGKRDFVHPIVLVEFFVPGLRKFQVIQTERNVMLLKVIIDGSKESVLANIRHRMNEILRGKKLDKIVRFDIEIVQDIPNDPKTGKYKLIIPLRGTIKG